jgi:hypothetical protein
MNADKKMLTTKDARATFTAALESLIEQVKKDKSILAAILGGSLSHDAVWAKSDIDLVLVTIDDPKAAREGLSLWADGVNVHAMLMQRTQFRKIAEGAYRNTFMHSFLAKGRLLYTHDPTIERICEGLREIGKRDNELALFAAACHVPAVLYKAHKFLKTRGDLEYTALWILHTAGALAKVEVLAAGLLADREVLPQAMQVNPEFFRAVYTELLNQKKTKASVERALAACDDYLAKRARRLFGPLLEYLRDVGEARSTTEIDDYFKRNYGIEPAFACEYLADRGLISKVPVPLKLTKKSNVEVEELGYFHAGE